MACFSVHANFYNCAVMTSAFKVACVQNCAGDDLDENMEQATALTRAAAEAGAALICLPEHFSLLAPSEALLLKNAFTENEHPALKHFRGLAGELKVWLLLGSLAIRLPAGRMNNRSCLLNDQGDIVARYDKLHLFDVSLKGGESYRESATVQAGDRAVVATTPWGLLGMSVCYDVRFAHLYRQLAQAGAAFLSIPAAFTRTPGQAHWHSLIVDPWGGVLADGGDEPGFIIADVDPSRVEEARRMIPALTHDRTPPPVERR